jgi:hypothetical protein
MANIGMYASGIPLGYMVDRKPKYGVMLGAFALGAGYFPIKRGTVLATWRMTVC